MCIGIWREFIYIYIYIYIHIYIYIYIWNSILMLKGGPGPPRSRLINFCWGAQGPKNAFLVPLGSQGGLPWGSQGALWADWPWAMGRWALGHGPMGPLGRLALWTRAHGPRAMGPGTRNEYNVNGRGGSGAPK